MNFQQDLPMPVYHCTIFRVINVIIDCDLDPITPRSLCQKHDLIHGQAPGLNSEVRFLILSELSRSTRNDY